PVPGELVHLEGTPTVVGNRLYMGGGAAGVLCVQIDKLSLDGKEMDLPAVRKHIEGKWKELLAKYEADKKKDPEFAVKPNEDQLPKPVPTVLWQAGKEKWHVDAPVAVAGDKVLVASAFLDKEKVGDRALFCLDAKSGKQLWRAPLKLNPWGGPTVAGDLAIVSGSTIGYDPNVLKGAKGEITAIAIADGKEKWNKTLPGGVLACVAVADGKVIACATDGKVRTYNLADGGLGWFYNADKTPIFAAPAVVAGVVYAGDLRGVVHAIDLKTGTAKWKLDLGADPVKAPGMIYGGPVVDNGRIYVATCNLNEANKPTAVVCIGQ
ncbi:MAG: PQQ-binding-like beta-propeller repeat protein, partial [Gemmataceae bacterium]